MIRTRQPSGSTIREEVTPDEGQGIDAAFLRISSAQKIRDLIEVIAWDEDSLLELISKRIGVSLPETNHLDARARWNSIFGNIFSATRGDSFSYVVERNLFRPREVIQFCDTLRDVELKRRRGAEFFRDTVREAEYTHSEARHNDIAAEYRFHYKGLRHVFDTFRGCPADRIRSRA